MKKLLDYLPNNELNVQPSSMSASPVLGVTTPLKLLSEQQLQDIEIIVSTIQGELDAFMKDRSDKKVLDYISKIVLFGCHAKGTWMNDPVTGFVSGYDILVMVSQDALVEEYEIWQRIEKKVTPNIAAPIGLIVLSQREINERLLDGSPFFQDIRNQGIELYDADGVTLPLSTTIPFDDQLRVANTNWSLWSAMANDFIALYHSELNKGPLNKAAFLLHQAAEYFFACTLLVCTNYLPKTHNLEHLRSLCAQHNDAFAILFPADNQANHRSFQLLKSAYADDRYSEHYAIT